MACLSVTAEMSATPARASQFAQFHGVTYKMAPAHFQQNILVLRMANGQWPMANDT